MTPDELAEVRARVDAATGGKWTALSDGTDDGDIVWVRATDIKPHSYDFRDVALIGSPDMERVDDQTYDDARFIAHAREDVPRLLAEVERLRDAVAERDTRLAETIRYHDARVNRADEATDAARADLARRDAALASVLTLHTPIAMQEADEHGMPHEPGTGHDWPPICHACSDPAIIAAVEFGDLIERGEGAPWPCATFAAITDAMGEATTCHCGGPLHYGFDGDPSHHRGMCADCDLVRCDAYPGECGR